MFDRSGNRAMGTTGTSGTDRARSPGTEPDGSGVADRLEQVADRAEDAVERIEHAAAQVEERLEDTCQPATRAVAERTSDWLRDQRWVLGLTRVGWVAKAIVYFALAWATVVIGRRTPGGPDATYTGIVELLAGGLWSRLVLVVIALGLMLYIAFRLVSILLIDTGDLDAWAHRIGFAASAATYVVVAWAAFDAAVSGTHEEGRSSLERYSAELLASVPGRILIGLGAVGALGVAAYFVRKGLTRSFVKQLRLDGLGDRHRRLLVLAGAIGWVGRAVIVAAVAGFLLWAAIQADPHDARGLDRALHQMAFRSSVGTWAVFGTGVLLAFYAAYCLASAPYRSVVWSHGRATDPERPESEHFTRRNDR